MSGPPDSVSEHLITPPIADGASDTTDFLSTYTGGLRSMEENNVQLQSEFAHLRTTINDVTILLGRVKRAAGFVVQLYLTKCLEGKLPFNPRAEVRKSKRNHKQEFQYMGAQAHEDSPFDYNIIKLAVASVTIKKSTNGTYPQWPEIQEIGQLVLHNVMGVDKGYDVSELGRFINDMILDMIKTMQLMNTNISCIARFIMMTFEEDFQLNYTEASKIAQCVICTDESSIILPASRSNKTKWSYMDNITGKKLYHKRKAMTKADWSTIVTNLRSQFSKLKFKASKKLISQPGVHLCDSILLRF